MTQELRYRGIVMQMPWLDRVFRHNPIANFLFKSSNPFMVRASQLLEDRKQGKSGHADYRDFVDRFLEAGKAHPDVVNETTLMRYLSTNMLADPDTTAVALRFIFYFALKHPAVLSRMRAEMDEKIAVHPVPYKEGGAHKLPYIEAVIREAFRLHFITGFLLQRVVPEDGLTLADGTVLPAGTQVGANGWTIHFDKDVFGEDAESSRPERWLQDSQEGGEVFSTRLSRMRAADMTFSKGPRNCLGRWIVELELRKIVPILFGVFDVSVAIPNLVFHSTPSPRCQGIVYSLTVISHADAAGRSKEAMDCSTEISHCSNPTWMSSFPGDHTSSSLLRAE